MFWHIITRPPELNFERSKVDLIREEIDNKRLFAELAFELRNNLEINPSSYSLVEGLPEILQEADRAIREFIKLEIKEAKQKLIVPYGDSIQLAVDNIP